MYLSYLRMIYKISTPGATAVRVAGAGLRDGPAAAGVPRDARRGGRERGRRGGGTEGGGAVRQHHHHLHYGQRRQRWSRRLKLSTQVA